jgi:16S rRNA (cytidine1402-2'-O)-methyltransferase
MPGTLYVVATPIGNLEDVTFRALRILREVSLIAAEDTRRTARLLQQYSISTRTTSLHEHNERARTPALIARLQAGESIALVSDAGTPVVSDPGRHLVAAAHEAGIRVEPIPGPSAVVAAVSASGLGRGEFAFVGFPPSRSSARKKWLEALKVDGKVLVMYEAPHRILQTLSDMLEVLGDRTVAIGRELTKAHEELVVRPISGHLAAGLKELGEYTLVVGPADTRGAVASDAPPDAQVAVEFGEMTETAGFERREALRLLGKKYGLTTRQVYATLERTKKSVN